MNFTSKKWHDKKVKSMKPILAYDQELDFESWRKEVRIKIEELLGDMPDFKKYKIELIKEETYKSFTEINFVIKTEDDFFPCTLLIPSIASPGNPVPVIMCLQGHETGMHLSLGTPENNKDEELLLDNMDFGIQAIENGFAALLIEMRFMGERRFIEEKGKEVISCYRPTMGALLMGSTTIGLRVADIRTSISALSKFTEYGLKTDEIICLGHSGGGTATFFAACLDERISATIFSCALCDFEYSILHTEHCSCNFIPGLYKYFNMSDMAAAIFPRPILSLGGIYDDIFLIEGVEKTLNKIDQIYSDNGVEGHCHLIKGKGGHMFFREEAWPKIKEVYKLTK